MIDERVRFRLAGGGGTVAVGSEAVERAAGTLAAGGLLVHPTSTLYGIGGRPAPALDLEIARLKRRPPGPLIVVAADLRALETSLSGFALPPAGRALADAFWPGPLTLVVDDGGAAGLAVRVEAHPVLRAVLGRIGGVMTSTSLNRTGEPPAIDEPTLAAALDRLGPARVPLGILSVGTLGGSVPSTIVSLRADGPALLRPGAIDFESIRAVLRDAPATRREP